MTGPGAVPLYVQAGKVTPLSDLDVTILRNEGVFAHAAGLVRERLGRVRERVEVDRAAGGREPPRRSWPRGP